MYTTVIRHSCNSQTASSCHVKYCFNVVHRNFIVSTFIHVVPLCSTQYYTLTSSSQAALGRLEYATRKWGGTLIICRASVILALPGSLSRTLPPRPACSASCAVLMLSRKLIAFPCWSIVFCQC